MHELGPDWNYPIHLGVTEAGDGEDGRIKSAIGIGSLLCDGIGDTIRVSLTEDSVHEIPVAQALVANVLRASDRARSVRSVPIRRMLTIPLSIAAAAASAWRPRASRSAAKRRVRVVVRQAQFDKIAHKLESDGRLPARDHLRAC